MTASSSEASRALEDARDALARGDVGRAVRKAWASVNAAVQTDDGVTLAAALEVTSRIREQAKGARAREVAILNIYASRCLDDLRSGVEHQSIIDRLLLWRIRLRTKRCPDCAETVRAEARVCRFCGYRFEPAEASRTDSARTD